MARSTTSSIPRSRLDWWASTRLACCGAMEAERHPRQWVDLIVEGARGRVVAIEVKLAATVEDRDVRHLNWLQQQSGDRVADRIVITTGEYAYRRRDGVGVVPLALLGP